jgi:YD repeat-containing protein
MTEEQIERIVESRIDRIDAAWSRTNWTQDEYDRRIAEVDAWAQEQYRKHRNMGNV